MQQNKGIYSPRVMNPLSADENHAFRFPARVWSLAAQSIPGWPHS